MSLKSNCVFQYLLIYFVFVNCCESVKIVDDDYRSYPIDRIVIEKQNDKFLNNVREVSIINSYFSMS
jgi:hypothetical protein